MDLVERLREFDSYRGRLSFTELKTLDEACAALASRPPPIVSGDERIPREPDANVKMTSAWDDAVFYPPTKEQEK